MQIEELFDLTNWVDEQLVKKLVLESYTALLNIIQHNAQPGTSKQSFETQKASLIDALLSVELSKLSTGQLDVLR